MTDETLINRVVRRTRKEYEGDERRSPPPMSVSDYMKFLPLIAAVVAGSIGYGSLQQRVVTLERDDAKADAIRAAIKAENRDMHKELWKAIRAK